jgi:hypothetical protein
LSYVFHEIFSKISNKKCNYRIAGRSGARVIAVYPETFGVNNETLGVDNKTLGVDSETLGVDNETLGVDNETLGVDTETFGVDNETPGVDTETFGVDNKTHAAAYIVPKEACNYKRSSGRGGVFRQKKGKYFPFNPFITHKNSSLII